MTPLLARLSVSMMLPTARSLEMVTCLGKVVMVSLSPAPVTRGVEPEGNEEDLMSPLVRCLNRVSCSSFGFSSKDLNRGVGRPSKALLVGAKIVTGPGRLRMSMRSANWSRETKMEKSGLWTRRSRAEHSRSLQSRPADGGTLFCRLGGCTGLLGSMGCCRGAMKGSRPGEEEGGGEKL